MGASSLSTSNQPLFIPCLKHRWHCTPETPGKSSPFFSILSCLFLYGSRPLFRVFFHPCSVRQCSCILWSCRMVYGHFLQLIPSFFGFSHAGMAFVVGGGNWNSSKSLSFWIIPGIWLNSSIIRLLSSLGTFPCFLPAKWV